MSRVGIGQFREISPCPKNGKITFKQVGAIRGVSSSIEMNDSGLLKCRAMAVKKGADGKSELDGYGNAIYVQAEATNDPSDYYAALWGDLGNLTDGNTNLSNDYGEWYVENEFFTTNTPSEDVFGGWRNGIQEAVSVDYDSADTEGERGIKLSAKPAERSGGLDPLGQIIWSPVQVDSTVKGYVGRLPSGQTYHLYWEWKQTSTQNWDERPTMKVAAWSGGYKASEVVETLLEETHRGVEWKSCKYTFDVPTNGYQDIWIEFRQDSPNRSGYTSSSIFKNVQIWRA
jgi:hypothetical protein